MILKFLAFTAGLFLFGCGSGEKTFNYDDKSVTEGLQVKPSALNFTEAGAISSFIIHFSEKDLILLDIDYSSLTDNFTAVNPIEAKGCRQNISASEQGCRIDVRYNPIDVGSHSGKIILYFIYTQNSSDNNTKEHDLNITGTN